MIILILLFSIWPTFVDVIGEIAFKQIIGLSSVGMYGSQWGYTIIDYKCISVICMGSNK